MKLSPKSRLVCLASILASLVAVPPARAISPDVVLSQVYGGGGNSGATLRNDFIELFNRGTAAVSLDGGSVQYASSAGTTWQRTNLAGVIAPGGYYLVQQAQGAGGTVDLPPPDAIGTIAMSATSAKVALVNDQVTLSGSCPLGGAVVDFVGYGTANCFEGSAAAPTLTNTTAALRAAGGCTETDSNATDFGSGAPNPRNTASPPNACGVSGPTGVGAADPSSLPAGGSVLLTVAVTPGSNPPSTGITATADLTPIGGSATTTLTDDGMGGDLTAGDLVFSVATSVAAGTPAGPKTLAVSLADNEGRSGSTTIALAVEAAFLAIHEIQGSSTTSPHADSLVATSGIVTARKSNGFFLQTPDELADADLLTSQGIFVFTSSAPPPAAAAGNEVRVSGRVTEFVPPQDPFSPPLTEIAGGPVVTLLTAGNPLPAPVVVTAADTDPMGSIEQLERLEGMRVHVEQLEAVAPTQGFINEPNASATSNGVFYAVVAGLARPFREPGVEVPDPLPPGSPCCVPRFDANPERLRVDSDSQVGAAVLDVTSGALIENVTGVVDYAFRTYTVLPDPGTPPTVSGLRTAVPLDAAPANQFTAASANLQRFYDTVDDPLTGDSVLTPAAFGRRLAKASLVVRQILRTPDVLGVQEVENLTALQAIADRVNADAVAAGDPDPGYQAHLFEGNDVGGIDVGFLVKSPRVEVVSVEQIGKDATFINPTTGLPELLNDRPSLYARLRILRSGATPFAVSAIVNHLRSLSGIDDPDDGARVRAKRRAQAEFLAAFIQSLQSADPQERVVSVGDYNAFSFNDGYVDGLGTIKGTPTPVDEVVLASADLVDPDLVELMSDEPLYSFSFDGNAQALDHVLVSANFASQAALRVAHSNTDFPEIYRNDDTRPERLSDHDMLVASFTLPVEADLQVMKAANPDPVESASVVSYHLGVTNPGPDAAAQVAVADGLPTGLTFEAVEAPAGWACTTPAVGSGGTVSCTRSALAPGGTGTIVVSARVACAVVDGAQLANTAAVSSVTADPNLTNNAATATVAVVNAAPSITDVSATPSVLFPPNHRMVPVTIAYDVTDSCPVSCSLSAVSNQPEAGPGHFSPDIVVLSDHNLLLRAERLRGQERLYTATISCADTAGGASQAQTTVRVP